MINAPVIKIVIDEVDVIEHGLNVQDVTVDLSLDSFGCFSIVISGSADPTAGTAWMDNDIFTVGRKVSISMGSGPDRSRTMIVGEISNVMSDFPSDGTPTIEIIGDDSRDFVISKNRRRPMMAMSYGAALLSFSSEMENDSQIGEEFANVLTGRGLGSLSATKNEKLMRSRSVLDQIQKGTIIATGECVGDTEVVPGRTLMLEGLGKKYSRPYQVTGSIHSVDRNIGYRTTFMATTK
jgi:hypothetical protein